VAVALLVGAVLGFVATREPTDEPEGQSMAVSQFVQRIDRRTDTGDSVLTDILIEPARMSANDEAMQKVTFKEMRRHRETGQWEPVAEWWMAAPIPFFKIPPGGNQNWRVADFLAAKAKDIPSLDYQYAWWQVAPLENDTERKWWQTARNMFGLIVAASVLVIGILWPITIRVLVKMGFGDPEIETKGIDLSKASSRSETPLVAASGPTQDDAARLAALNAELEAKVGDMLVDEDRRDEEAEIREEEEAIRKLSNAPIEPVAAETAKADDKDFTGGEFYPVARPHVKKDA
jgi:hypothetical protein